MFCKSIISFDMGEFIWADDYNEDDIINWYYVIIRVFRKYSPILEWTV